MSLDVLEVRRHILRAWLIDQTCSPCSLAIDCVPTVPKCMAQLLQARARSVHPNVLVVVRARKSEGRRKKKKKKKKIR